MTLRHIAFCIAAFGLAAGGAHAADNKAQSQGYPVWSDAPGFNELDKDGDGALTRSEAGGNPWLAKHFKEADDDGNGKLSRVEYLQRMAMKDLNTVREGAADLIEPGDQPSSGGTKK